ncbi:hypothetical protein VTJ49DRAFT_6617 [Mycothermus thermophilus]|uniref:Alpha/beta hydrolase fold-3 domain-containing protein n=1 Tax=Humicola insolens TaxID=85995 RepID=A0ABR3VIT2_HUMIN
MSHTGILNVDGIPVVNLVSPPQPGEIADARRLETASDVVGPAPSRRWLRLSAYTWRSLQYMGMTLHYRASPRPPSPSFTKTIPTTISQAKGEFDLVFYTPRDYAQVAETDVRFPAVINFHGGGFTIGSAADDARFARCVLEQCNAVFVSVYYRLAPEHPFPVAAQDSADAILYVIRHAAELHIDPEKLAVSGFSAGGNLALTSVLCLNDHLKTLRTAGTDPVPAHRIRAAASWYPVTDYTIPREVKRASCPRPDQTLPPLLTNLFDASYLHPPDLSVAHPYLSPSRASDEQLAAAMPEMVIIYTCEWDMLRKEGEEFADRLRQPPIARDVRYKMIERVPHAWDKSPDPIKPAAGAEEAYRECLTKPPPLAGLRICSQFPEVAQIDFGNEAPEVITSLDRSALGTTTMSGWQSQSISPPPVKYQDDANERQQLQQPPEVVPPSHFPTPRYLEKGSWSWIRRPSAVTITGLVIIVLLGAVAGLATAFALQTRRVNNGGNSASLASSNCSSSSCATNTATVTTTVTLWATTGATNPQATRLDLAIADVSNGCNDPNEKITGTTYTPRRTQYPVFKRVTFVRHCNKELKPRPIFGMLVHDFDACMDACAIWSRWCPDNFGRQTNATCTGVRFVPAWSDRSRAYYHSARGNCFLHSDVTKGDLKEPQVPEGVTCHSALVLSADDA